MAAGEGAAGLMGRWWWWWWEAEERRAELCGESREGGKPQAAWHRLCGGEGETVSDSCPDEAPPIRYSWRCLLVFYPSFTSPSAAPPPPTMQLRVKCKK